MGFTTAPPSKGWPPHPATVVLLAAAWAALLIMTYIVEANAKRRGVAATAEPRAGIILRRDR